ESLAELVHRAQRRIVLAELDALGELATDPSTRSRLDALVSATFLHIEDWIAYVGHEVNGSAQEWIHYRWQLPDERGAYQNALREALAAMQRLAEASKATQFLRDVGGHSDWPELAATCSRISVALTIAIDLDAKAPLLVVPVSPPTVVAERSS